MAMNFKDIASFVAFSAGLDESLKKANRTILETAAIMIENEAKNLIGTPHPFWPPLQPATIAQKAHGNTPLLETGELRASIGHEIVNDNLAIVGSDSDVAVFQELGTSTIPARSFLEQAAVSKEKEIVEVAKEIAEAAFLPHSLQGALAKIVVDAIKNAAHDLKADFEDLTNPNSEPASPREAARAVGRAADHAVGHLIEGLKRR